MPLIHAMRQGSPQQASIIREAIEQGRRDRIDEIIQIIHATGAVDYTAQAAANEVEQAKQALSPLADSEYKQALIGLADFAIARQY